MTFIRKYWNVILVTIILLSLYISLLRNHSKYFDEIEHELSSQKVVCLDNKFSQETLKAVLQNNHYVQTEKEAVFIANILTERFDSVMHIGSLSELKNNFWKATIEEVENYGGECHKESYARMCYDLEQYYLSNNQNTSNMLSKISVDEKCEGKIKVFVYEKQKNVSYISKLLKKDKTPCSEVYVRLNEHDYDEESGVVSEIPVAILKTNEDGFVVFEGLDVESSYSVLPIKEGFKYGSAKGTTRTILKDFNKGKMEIDFMQSPITIPLIDSNTLRQIKEDGTFIVRTPDDFKRSLFRNFFLIIILWWGIVLLLNLFRRKVDVVIVSSLMGLTGICILMMYSLHNPLMDTILGEEMFPGIFAGGILLFLVQFINPIAFYQDRLKLRFDYLSSIFKVSKGWGYLFFGLFLTLLLFPFGSEVGGMNVNLNLFGLRFQPSEITKYLIVVFLSAYFCQNAEKIILYSNSGSVNLLRHKLLNMTGMILGFAFLMFIYIALQDLGPAMVVAFTFIIQYSLIKSKVDLKGLDSDNPHTQVSAIRNLLTCDFALLIYGVITFVICLYLGSLLKVKLLGAISWFVAWIIGGWSKRKFIESPILFNIIITAFVFGSSLQYIPISACEKIGERLEARASMCTNTWGVLDATEQVATENSQVVEGLWGLATGGLNGQGLSRGECTFIPAYKTDMILESIGTQLGFCGILLVMLLYCMLLRRSIVVGYKSYHPFSFYLCTGISIVTGIQILLIALGSLGIIPLTGVAVPFLSYGKVSMILNLFAFGLILSVSHYGCKSNLDHSMVNKYNGPTALLTGVFTLLILFVCGTFFKYQVLDRKDTLMRHLFVKTSNQEPEIRYNPRIQLLTKKMRMGDIYDRNGVLLATSDKRKLKNHTAYTTCKLKSDTIKKQSRYYPFGEHLFFMVGDYNTKLFFNTKDQRGYMAEYRHLDSLRGYDNIKEKINILPVKVSAGKFVLGVRETDTIKNFALRDYSDLLPYLKAGIQSDRVKDYNNDDENWWKLGKIRPNDIHLTVDAILQTRLQQGIEEHMQKRFSEAKYNKTRVSVVILDAKKGDLLASAVYPLPDYKVLHNLSPKELDRYSDSRDSKWKAYTDMDLGVCFPTAPGSTAKVTTGLAGLKKCGVAAGAYKFYYDSIEKVGADPNRLRNKWVNMNDAITWSSNNYMIKLLNTCDLYEELGNIYHQLGVDGIADRMKAEKDEAIKTYNSYYKKDIKNRGSLNCHRAWQWAWGQGSLSVTPLQMAKVVSIVGNEGKLLNTRYLLTEEISSTQIVQKKEADLMKAYMKNEAKEHSKFEYEFVGGKTGTPQRDMTDIINGKKVKLKPNDGWYICFIEQADIYPNDRHDDCIAIAVRMERLGKGDGDGGSGKAVYLTKDVVIKTLKELNYIQ